MDALDGNSIAGELFELFGREMTTATGACMHCDRTAQIGELTVYSKGPGCVVRCPSCGQVVIVLIDQRGRLRIRLDYFELPAPPPGS